MHECRCGLWVFMALAAIATLAAATPVESAVWKRWAVVADSDLRNDGLSDLLTAELTQDGALELVEREQLTAVLKELEVAACLGPKDQSRRLQLGKLLRADALVLLSLEKRGDVQSLRLIIADCVYGARLRHEVIARYSSNRVDELAARCVALIQSTRERFAGGIRRLIGVSPFLSENLSHDDDHLQAGWGALLAASLSRRPGVAVLEIDEARSIRTEVPSDGQVRRRVVPLFVEGDYRTSRAKPDAAPTVELALRLTDGREVRQEVQSGFSLTEAADFLTNVLPKTLLGRLEEPETQPLSRSQQFDLLTQRAHAFSQLGIREHSTSLREAALLLKPDAHLERMRLVIDYRRWLTSMFRQQASQALSRIPYRDRPGVQEIWFAERWFPARGMVHHSAELIRRRCVNPREAAALVALTSNRAYGLPQVRRTDQIEATRKLLEPFLWEAITLIPTLDPDLRDGTVAEPFRLPEVVGFVSDGGKIGGPPLGSLPRTPSRQREMWLSNALDVITKDWPRIDLNSTGRGHANTLKFLEKYFTLIPEHDVPVGNVAELIFRLLPGLAVRSDSDAVSRDGIQALYRRLVTSESEIVRFYGRLGLWECRAAQMSGLSDELKRERDDLLAFVRNRIRSPDHSKSRKLYEQALTTNGGGATITRARRSGDEGSRPGLAKGKRHPLTASPFQPTGRWTKLSIQPAGLDEPIDGWQIIPAGSCDILWSLDAIQVLRRNGEKLAIDSILTLREPTWLNAVVWDGKYIWAATSDQGVLALSTTGESIARLGQDEGLPQYDMIRNIFGHRSHGSPQALLTALPQQMLFLFPVSPGRCMITGVNGPRFRRWFVLASESPDAAGTAFSLTTVHNATGVSGEEDSARSTFRISWWTHLRSRTGVPEALLIGRVEQTVPFVLRFDGLKASLFPHQLLCTGIVGTDVISYGGRIFTSEPHYLSVYGDDSNWSRRVLAESQHTSARLLLHDDLVHRPGRIWLTVDPGSLSVERLHDAVLPPVQGFQLYGQSATLGLVGWNVGQQLHSIEMLPERNAVNRMARDAYVPAALRANHHTAAERLRSRGALVGGRYRRPRDDRAAAPAWRTAVFLGRKWAGSDDDLELLTSLFNLSDLYLVGADVGDAGLRHVAQVASLESLFVEETDVTDAGIVLLSGLQNLSYCRLEGSADEPAFTDASLESLSSLPRLNALTLYGSGFTDNGLQSLQMYPALQSLLLLDTGTSRTGVDTLRRHRPRLRLTPRSLLQTRPDQF